MSKIKIYYKYEIFKINVRKHIAFAKLGVATRFLKVAWWLSPELHIQYEKTVVRIWETRDIPQFPLIRNC